MTSPDLIRLAQRLEDQPHGSRELDWVVAKAIGLPGLEWDDGEPTFGPHDEPPIPAPAYTSSLSAAVSMIPAGHGWSYATHHKFPDGVRQCAFVDGVPGFGNSPALCICIAALKVRSNDPSANENAFASEAKSLLAATRREENDPAIVEKLGQAVARAMGRYRGHEPLLEAVARLADDYHATVNSTWALLLLFDARPDFCALLGPKERAAIDAARAAVGGAE